MTNLTPEQRILGRENANNAIGVSRRDFLKGAAAAGVGAASVGGYYFGYKALEGAPVKAAIIGTGNEGCQAMIHEHNRSYIEYIGFCDIRPSQQERAKKEFSLHPQYTQADVKKLKQYAEAKEIFADPEVEVVVIALPLWLHAPIAIEAMKAGKHVFCEKLMAHSVAECKEMCKVAREKNRLLAIGHQRHYSALYDNANFLIQSGFLGEIRHIRALWHRNNAVPRIKKANGVLVYDPKTGDPEYERDDQGNILYYDSWKPPIPEVDRNVKYADFGYKSLDELVRWRLYDRTGAGLMAELGSHQLDACSIFLGKQHPISVTGVGGKFFYTDPREVDDHVFVTFEFPGAKTNDRVIVTYSSISTNAFEKYGEEVMGTKGTMIVEEEAQLMLYKENDPNTGKAIAQASTGITVEKTGGGKPALETSPSAAGPSVAQALGALATTAPSRGYREELEHFAYCVRNGDASNYHADTEHQPRCRGEVALADAVIALVSNMAMKSKRRIDFKPEWFDYASSEVPGVSPSGLAERG